MKFLVDMPLPPLLAAWLRDEGHDAVHANEISMYRASDEEILWRATRENRVVVTADLDFPRLLSRLEHTTASVVLFRGGDFDDKTAFEFMRRALAVIDEKDRASFVMAVGRHRIRRHWLK